MTLVPSGYGLSSLNLCYNGPATTWPVTFQETGRFARKFYLVVTKGALYSTIYKISNSWLNNDGAQAGP